MTSLRPTGNNPAAAESPASPDDPTPPAAQKQQPDPAQSLEENLEPDPDRDQDLDPDQSESVTRSATFRFALIYAFLFTIITVLLAGFIYYSTVSVLENQVSETVAAELRGLAESYNTDGMPGLLTNVENRSRDQNNREGIYLLVSPNNHRISGNLSAWPPYLLPNGEWTRFKVESPGNPKSLMLIGARGYELSGGFRILVGRDMAVSDAFRSNLIEALTWALAATLLFGLSGSYLISRGLLRRVDAVSNTTRRIMDGDLSHRVPLAGRNDEFDRLSVNLNHMLSRIEALMNGMRLATDSLAHDLRSPLTRLKGRIELALSKKDENIEELRQALEQANADIDQIQTTFNDLIAIAKAEAGLRQEEMQPLDLRALMEDLAELYEPVAEEQGRRLQLSTFSRSRDDAIFVPAQRQLLSQAIANLFDNALKHGRGDISCAIRQRADKVILEIADQGDGIPEESRQQVLTRFVRLDQSRSLPGSGLGLALVAAVAQMHHCQLELASNAPGLRVILTFTASKP
tara:strand:- start:616 stop:2169 length:1554 start_codon:yes stop_codon:yes gene_type:complete